MLNVVEEGNDKFGVIGYLNGYSPTSKWPSEYILSQGLFFDGLSWPTWVKNTSETRHYQIHGFPPLEGDGFFEPRSKYLEVLNGLDTTLKLLSGNWNFGQRVVSNENNVDHVNIRGDVTVNGRNLLSDGSLRAPSVRGCINYVLQPLPNDVGLYDLYVPVADVTVTRDMDDVRDRLNELVGGGFRVVGSDAQPYWGNIYLGPLRYVYNGTSLVILCCTYYKYNNGRHTAYLDCFRVFPSKGTLYEGENYVHPSYMRIELESQTVYKDGWPGGEGYPYWGADQQTFFENVSLNHTSAAMTGWDSAFQGSYFQTAYAPDQVTWLNTTRGSRLFSNVAVYSRTRIEEYPSLSIGLFKARALPLLSDCYGCSFLAFRDAVDKWSVDMRLNMAESSADLFGLMLPVQLHKLFAAIVRLRSLNGSKGRLLFEIVNLLTNAKLLYSFGLAPTFRDATVISQKASAFRERWLNGKTFDVPVTIHGKYKIAVPSELTEEFPNMQLVTRSKAVVSIDSDILLQILPFGSVGLLPSLSTLWAAIPFSFVADWIFPLGDSMKMLEDHVRFMALNVDHTVESVQCSYRLSADDINYLNLASVGENGVEYRLYDRVVLNRFPIVGPSRILSEEFQPGLPNWDIWGSLLFQVLK